MAHNEQGDLSSGSTPHTANKRRPSAADSRTYVLGMSLCVLAAAGAAFLPLVSGWGMGIVVGAQVACAVAGGIFLGMSMSKARAWIDRSDPTSPAADTGDDLTTWLPSRDGAGQ